MELISIDKLTHEQREGLKYILDDHELLKITRSKVGVLTAHLRETPYDYDTRCYVPGRLPHRDKRVKWISGQFWQLRTRVNRSPQN